MSFCTDSPSLLEIRNQMYYDIEKKYEQLNSISLLTRNEILCIMLIGKSTENCDKVHYFEISKSVECYVREMHCLVLKNREGIG